MVIILVEMVINLTEVIIIIVEIIIIFVEVVRRVAERISVIIGRVAGMATVKDRTRGAAGSIGYIAGAVVVATAVYTLLIYRRESLPGEQENQHNARERQYGGRERESGGREGQLSSREGRLGSREGRLGGREYSDKGNKKGEYRSTPLECIANINYSATVTVARRLKETGDSSSTPPLPLVVMLSRLTPILTSSSATVSARFSDRAWL